MLQNVKNEILGAEHVIVLYSYSRIGVSYIKGYSLW